MGKRKSLITNFTPAQLITLSDVFRKKVIAQTVELEKDLAEVIIEILENEGHEAALQAVNSLHTISSKYDIDMLLVMVEVSDIGGPNGLAFATPYLEAEFAKYDLETENLDDDVIYRSK